MHNITPTIRHPSVFRVLRLVWPFVAIVVLLLALGTASLSVIRGVRAYIGAESVWSNTQKAAVEALEQYAQTRNEDHFDRYVEEASVLAGARNARIELDKPFPDFAKARRGLLAARNHPADIEGMIDLFRRFRRMAFMTQAITLWTRADALFAQIDEHAQAIHAAVRGGRGQTSDLQPSLVAIRTLDRELTVVERAFSATLAQASRGVEFVLTFATLVIALALVAIAALRTHRLVRKEDTYLAALRASQQRYDYVISGTNDGIFDWRFDQRELYVSPRFEELVGYRPGTLRETAASFVRRVHHDDRLATLAALRRHLANGEPFDIEFRLRTADDSFRWFRMRGRSVFGEGTKPQRIAGSIADISDRKHAERETREQKERAEVTLASIADAVITVDL
ncbi:MAG TPA: PAS domain-containing protein, partial [Casimicrobiaceae bacterium]